MSTEQREIVARIEVAETRLRDLGLPTDPSKRWSGVERQEQVDATIDADQLYSVIEFGRRALEAHAAGNWTDYTDALQKMFGAEISSNLPEITELIARSVDGKRQNKGRDTLAGKLAQRNKDMEKMYLEQKPKIIGDLRARQNVLGKLPKKKNKHGDDVPAISLQQLTRLLDESGVRKKNLESD